MTFAGAQFATVAFAAKLDTLESVLPVWPPPIRRRTSTSLPSESWTGELPVDSPTTLPAIPRALLYLDFRKRPKATQSRLWFQRSVDTLAAKVAFSLPQNVDKVLLDFSRSIDSQYVGIIV